MPFSALHVDATTPHLTLHNYGINIRSDPIFEVSVCSFWNKNRHNPPFKSKHWKAKEIKY